MLILTSEAVTRGEFYDDCFCNLRNKNKIFMTPLTHSLEFSNDKRGRPLLLPNIKHLLVTHCGSWFRFRFSKTWSFIYLFIYLCILHGLHNKLTTPWYSPNKQKSPNHCICINKLLHICNMFIALRCVPRTSTIFKTKTFMMVFNR